MHVDVVLNLYLVICMHSIYKRRRRRKEKKRGQSQNKLEKNSIRILRNLKSPWMECSVFTEAFGEFIAV